MIKPIPQTGSTIRTTINRAVCRPVAFALCMLAALVPAGAEDPINLSGSFLRLAVVLQQSSFNTYDDQFSHPDFETDYRALHKKMLSDFESEVLDLLKYKKDMDTVFESAGDANRFGGGAVSNREQGITTWLDGSGNPVVLSLKYKDTNSSWYFKDERSLRAFVDPNGYTLIFSNGKVRFALWGNLSESCLWFLADEDGNLTEFGQVKAGKQWTQATVGEDGKMTSYLEYEKDTQETLIRVTMEGENMRAESFFLNAATDTEVRYSVRIQKPDDSYIVYDCPVNPDKLKGRYSEYDASGKRTKLVEDKKWQDFGIPIPKFKRTDHFAYFMSGGATAKNSATGTYVELPAVFDLERGSSITLSTDLDGHPAKEISLDAKSPWSVSPIAVIVDEPGAYDASKGTLSVTSEPTAGAKVSINGRDAGVTPLEYAYKGNKRVFDIKVEKQGITKESTINAEKAGTFRAGFDLDTEPRIWLLEGDDPGANVFLDGEAAGTIPCEVTAIGPGHRIDVKKEGYRTLILTDDPGPGKTARIPVRLKIDWEERRIERATMGFNFGGGAWLMPKTDVAPERMFYYGDLSASLASYFWLYITFGASGGVSPEPEAVPGAPLAASGDTTFFETHAGVGPQFWFGDTAILYAAAGVYTGLQLQKYDISPGWTIEEKPAEYVFYAGPQLTTGMRIQGKRFGIFAEATFRQGSKAEGEALKTGITSGFFLGAD